MRNVVLIHAAVLILGSFSLAQERSIGDVA